MKIEKLILLSVAALGVSAVMTQLALMRELLGAFAGNELVLGAILANWLLLTGLGTWLGRTAERLRQPARALILAQILVAVLPLAQVFAARALRNVVFIRGADVGLAQSVLSSFVLLAPYCLVSGYMLTLACAMGGAVLSGVMDVSQQCQGSGAGFQPAGQGILPSNEPLRGLEAPSAGRMPAPLYGDTTSANSIRQVYVADGLGSIAGGALFTFVLIPFLDHFALLGVPALLNLLVAAWLAVRFHRRILAGAAWLLAAAVAALLGLASPDARSTALQYPQHQVLFHGNSPYGRLVVTKREGQLDFLENGLPFVSTHHPERVEETVHYAMAQRPDARAVLLVSGGISGTAREILKYGVREVTCVELDPLILEAGRRFLPEALADARIKVVNTDGRLFIRQAAAAYDVVIVDMPDPSTSQINRFYTAEFFREAKRALAAGGVLGFALGRYENFVSPELARVLASAHRTANETFTNVLALPGGRVFFLASDGPLFGDIAARLERRGIATQWVSRNYLDGMLTPDRLADIGRALEAPAETNTDSHPVLYFYHLQHWMSQFDTRLGVAGAVLAVLLAAYLVRLRAVSFAVFASGFAASALEVVLLLGFQVLHGSLYRQLGVVVTAFMAGLAAGAFVAGRGGRKEALESKIGDGRWEVETQERAPIFHKRPCWTACHRLVAQVSNLLCRRLPVGRVSEWVQCPAGWKPAIQQIGNLRYAFRSSPAREISGRAAPAALRRKLAALAFGLAALAVALPGLLRGLGLVDGAMASSLAVQVAVPLVTFVLAALVGMEFALASRIEFRGAAATASRLYTADLVGASLGALLAGTLLIPLLGVTGACLVTAGLNAAGGAALLRRPGAA